MWPWASRWVGFRAEVRMGFPTGRRLFVLAAAVVVLVVVTAATVYRVLAPAEVSTPAAGTYPTAPAWDPAPGVIARLPAAPLVVDGRIRVYAAQRQVYADLPVTHQHRSTPYWSYRRWPAELVGVVASGHTVVTRWSDGRIVTLDGRTGRVTWQAEGPVPERDAAARYTGALSVWNPDGLFVSPAEGTEVVLSAGSGALAGWDLADGQRLWRSEVGEGCHRAVGTTTAGGLVSVDSCGAEATVDVRDAATGRVDRWRPPGASTTLAATPLGCHAGRSGCAGLRTAAGPGDDAAQGWLFGDGEPVAAPVLDRTDTVLAGGIAVGTLDGVLVGRDARTGAERWRREDVDGARVLAAEPDRVHLVTDRNDLVTLDSANGDQRSRFVLTLGTDGTSWAPGATYAIDGYLAVERLRVPVASEADDQRYFFTSRPVLLAAT
ncbi:outer membrane protein assembly factor BamB family protein [Salinispora arenicola]|uniref:outer membrane protein assembly factor BamB family protein n=1 Tax=Salinispora arenicola TaxID=168697 RepID=UPI0027DCA8C8|nr:PQQ-binding-like beta-propeller repeat protein [Salinispora arenicola]